MSALATSRSTSSLGRDNLCLLIVDGNVCDSIIGLGKVRSENGVSPVNSERIAKEVLGSESEIVQVLETCKTTVANEPGLITALRVAVCDGWQPQEKAK